MANDNNIREKIIEKIKALEAALAVIDEMNGSPAQNNSKTNVQIRKPVKKAKSNYDAITNQLPLVNVGKKKGRSTTPEVQALIDIVTNAKSQIKTSEIKEAYAKIIGSTPQEVEDFVERTLSRLSKNKTFEKTKVPNGRGNFYKLKTPR